MRPVPMQIAMSLQKRAELVLAGKCAVTNLNHRNAWAAVDKVIRESAPKNAKVFEVHHMVESARTLYFESLVAGGSVEECAAAASAVKWGSVLWKC